MSKITLVVGDFFFKGSDDLLDEAIKVAETVQELKPAMYAHAGLIVGADGATLEKLWHMEFSHINKYAGNKMLICRWSGMTRDAFQKAMDAVKDDVGTPYPVDRLFDFLIPDGPKIIGGIKTAVCSEEDGKELIAAGDDVDLKSWVGLTPQSLADIMLSHPDFTVVFQGVWDPALIA